MGLCRWIRLRSERVCRYTGCMENRVSQAKPSGSINAGKWLLQGDLPDNPEASARRKPNYHQRANSASKFGVEVSQPTMSIIPGSSG